MPRTIYRGDRHGDQFDEPLPAGAVAVADTADGCGGREVVAYFADEPLPDANYPQYPPTDADGYVGGRGWIGEPYGTEIKSAEQYRSEQPGSPAYEAAQAAAAERLAAIDRECGIGA